MDTDSIPQKQCCRKTLCINPLGSWLPATTQFFYRNKRHPDGLTNECQECAKERARQWREKHIEYARKMAREYQRNHREERRKYLKQYYEEHADTEKSRSREHYWNNRERHISIERERYQRTKDRDKEKRRRQLKRWRKNNPDKARAQVIRRRALRMNAEGSFDDADMEFQKKAQTDKRGRLHCWWCGKVITAYHIEHVLALKRGGSNYPSNLVLSCDKCNSSKGDKLLSEWNGRLL